MCFFLIQSIYRYVVTWARYHTQIAPRLSTFIYHHHHICFVFSISFADWLVSFINVNVRECFKGERIVDCRDKAGAGDIVNYSGDVDENVERM